MAIEKILNYLKIVHKQPKNISRKFERDSSTRTGDMTDNLFSVRKGVNEENDRHTRNVKSFKISVPKSQKCRQKI